MTQRSSSGMGRRLLIGGDSIAVESGSCPVAGVRHYFLCDCGRRVLILYAGAEGWRCRHCYDLTYETRRISPLYRHMLKAQRIRRTLGGSANLLEDFPARPRGMRPKRYSELKARNDAAYDRSIGMLAKAAFALRDHIWRQADQ